MEENKTPDIDHTPNAIISPPDENPQVHKSSKIILWILAPLVVIALLGSGVYGFVKGWKEGKKEPITTSARTSPITPTPTPDPTVMWPSYEGKEFRLSYPQHWGVTTSQDEEIVSFSSPCHISQSNTGMWCPDSYLNDYSITITRLSNPNNLKPEEYFDTVIFPESTHSEREIISDAEKNSKSPNVTVYFGSLAGPAYIQTLIPFENEFISIRCDECDIDFNNQVLSTLDTYDPALQDKSLEETISYTLPEGWSEEVTIPKKSIVLKSKDYIEGDGKPVSRGAWISLARQPRGKNDTPQRFVETAESFGIHYVHSYRTKYQTQRAYATHPVVGSFLIFKMYSDNYVWTITIQFEADTWEEFQIQISKSDFVDEFLDSIVLE